MPPKKSTKQILTLPEFKCEKTVSETYRIYVINNEKGEFPKKFKNLVKNIKDAKVKVPFEFFAISQICDNGDSLELCFHINKDYNTELISIKNGKKSRKKQILSEKESDAVIKQIIEMQLNTNDVITPIMKMPIPILPMLNFIEL